MAVRIYSLAKDVGLDSKELVDLCARLGIQNKGSALASLEDDEIAKIKKHLEEKSSATAAPPPPPKPAREPVKDAPIRDLSGKLGGAKRDLSSTRRAPATVGSTVSEGDTHDSSASGSEEVEQTESIAAQGKFADAAEPAAPPMVAESTPATVAATSADTEPAAETEEADAESAPVAREASDTAKPAGPGPLRRDDYYAPAQTSGKVRVLGRQRPPAGAAADGSKPTGERSDRSKRSREPVLNLARIPKSATPPPSAKPQEQATQKPIVKLTRTSFKA